MVIKLRAIGDVVLSTVVLDSLRKSFPHSNIDFLTEKYCKDVLFENPNLNSVLTYDSRNDNGLSLIYKIRRRRYDLVIDLFGNPRSALVTFFSGSRYRVGYRFGWRRYCYNIVVNPRGGEVHNTEFNLDALRAISIPIINPVPQFFVTQKEIDFAHDFFKSANLESNKVIAINPGGGWYTKRWLISHYARISDIIMEKYKAKILLLWGPGEENYVREIIKVMKNQAVQIPATNLKQLAAILQKCSLIVTNDSGPMHIAAAVGVPVVAIFGPTNPALQGPVGTKTAVIQNKELDCLGCNLTKCPIGNPCMEKLTVEEVLKGVELLLRD